VRPATRGKNVSKEQIYPWTRLQVQLRDSRKQTYGVGMNEVEGWPGQVHGSWPQSYRQHHMSCRALAFSWSLPELPIKQAKEAEDIISTQSIYSSQRRLPLLEPIHPQNIASDWRCQLHHNSVVSVLELQNRQQLEIRTGTMRWENKFAAGNHEGRCTYFDEVTGTDKSSELI